MHLGLSFPLQYKAYLSFSLVLNKCDAIVEETEHFSQDSTSAIKEVVANVILII